MSDALSPAIQFGGTPSARDATCAMRTVVSEPSNRHGLPLCHEYNPKLVRCFMLVPAMGHFGLPMVKGLTQATLRLGSVAYRTFPECFRCISALGRLKR
jgi:hypothetical protein